MKGMLFDEFFRLQMTIFLSGTVKDGMQAKDLLPVYVLMAKPISDTEVAAGVW